MQEFDLRKNKITTTINQRMSVEKTHRSIISKHSYKNIRHRAVWVQYLCGA